MDKPSKMLIDATHPEETRVVVVKSGRVEEFDYESAARKPLRGNIYLAKVTRVEPSLQAAFVDYGGNRHGFLAFNEIHPDYYQIPVADRRALLEAEAEAEAEAERLADQRAERQSRRRRGRDGDGDGQSYDNGDAGDSFDAEARDAAAAHGDDADLPADREGGAGQFHTTDHADDARPAATMDIAADPRVSEPADAGALDDGAALRAAEHIEEVPDTGSDFSW
jgi:ribonuclease E